MVVIMVMAKWEWPCSIAVEFLSEEKQQSCGFFFIIPRLFHIKYLHILEKR